MPRSKPLSRQWHRWHRRIGVVSALFVIILSVTGFVLLFVDGLGLKNRTLNGPVINAVYSTQVTDAPVGIHTDDQKIFWVEGFLYIGEQAGVPTDAKPDSFFIDDDLLNIIAGEEVFLFLPDGQFVEKVQSDTSITSPVGRPFEVLVGESKKEALSKYRGKGMTLDRIILDIHTGRFFGPVGPWVMGLASILLLLLSLSGLIMWTGVPARRRARAERRKQRISGSKTD